jgi:hypothetical protein
MDAQQSALEREAMGAGMAETFRLMKKYPLGAAPSILILILFMSAMVLLVFLTSENVSLAITAVACTILAALIFAFYVSYRRADERWLDFAKGHIVYFFRAMAAVLIFHSGIAQQLFGFGSSTFVTFAILTVVVLALIAAIPGPKER